MIETIDDDSDEPIEDLVLTKLSANCVLIEYIPLVIEPDSPKSRLKLMKIDEKANFVRIYPYITFPGDSRYLERKYHLIESITLEGLDFSTPKTIAGFFELLEELPLGFSKNYGGLGLLKDYHHIIDVVERVSGIRHLVISCFNDTHVNGDTFSLSYSDFDAIRRGINRITRSHQKESRNEKEILAFNSILHKMNPVDYPEKQKPYKKNVVHKLVSETPFAPANLSSSDADAIVELLSNSKDDIYRKRKRRVIQLKEELELLDIERLISEIEHLLSRNSSENDWQNLFSDNPFVLSLVFGYPVITVRGQTSVGGRRLDGAGDKITDFLIKNDLTNNAALVEIKKPTTSLLKTSRYREGVYAGLWPCLRYLQYCCWAAVL